MPACPDPSNISNPSHPSHMSYLSYRCREPVLQPPKELPHTAANTMLSDTIHRALRVQFVQRLKHDEGTLLVNNPRRTGADTLIRTASCRVPALLKEVAA